MIELKKIKMSYDKKVILKNISFNINKGEFVVVLGPNGSGKSTILNIISGILKCDSGKLLFENKDITKYEPYRRNISMIFQNYALYPQMTVYDNLAFSLKCHKVDKNSINEKVKNISNKLSLNDKLEKYPNELSGGEQQRVAIARALVKNSNICLMDEPLANLDSHYRQEMIKVILSNFKDENHSIVYVTHNQTEAMILADKIIVLNEGKVEQIGNYEELYNNPTNMFVAEFIGDPKMNIIEFNNKQSKFYLGFRAEKTSFESIDDSIKLEANYLSSIFAGKYQMIDCLINNTVCQLIVFNNIKKVNKKFNIFISKKNLYYFDINTKERVSEI